MAMLMMRKLMKMIFMYDHDEYLPDVIFLYEHDEYMNIQYEYLLSI